VNDPAPVRLLLPTRTASSPSLERRLKSSSLARRRRPGATAPSLSSTRRRRVCSPSLTVWSLCRKENPNGGWWLKRSGCGLALPLKPGAANVVAKAPNYPGFDRPGGRGGAGSLRASQDAGARDARGQKRKSCPEPG
jgi:hypothetical protein